MGSLIVGDYGELGQAAYENIICRLNLEDGTMERRALPERFYDRYGTELIYQVGMSDGIVVMAGRLEAGVLAVLAQDLDGNILLDQTYYFEGLLQGPYNYVNYCGRDETNLYLYRGTGYDEPSMLIAVALNGSGAAVLWDGNRGPH